MRRAAVPAIVAALVFALSGCGDDDGGDSGGDAKPRLTVSAAASLKGAFEAYGKEFPDATTRFSFAGSDELAAQIRKGVKPDVFAAANTKLPDQLFDEGKVEKPMHLRRQPPGAGRAGRLDEGDEPGRPGQAGREARGGRRVGAGRAPTPARCWAACPPARRRRSWPTCAPTSRT